MAFRNGVVPEDWRSAVIVSLYKVKGERNEYSNYSKEKEMNIVTIAWLEKCIQRP